MLSAGADYLQILSRKVGIVIMYTECPIGTSSWCFPNKRGQGVDPTAVNLLKNPYADLNISRIARISSLFLVGEKRLPRSNQHGFFREQSINAWPAYPYRVSWRAVDRLGMVSAALGGRGAVSLRQKRCTKDAPPRT